MSEMTQQDRASWLIDALKAEMPQYADAPIPREPNGQFRLLRGLMNVRPPKLASEAFLSVQDSFLRRVIEARGVTEAMELEPCARDSRLCLWQGDITTLRCDAIVNAANSQMLGCFAPCHGCIDNIIHTMSGVQLRLRCDELMREQGYDEPTGRAKITPGYNLPASYVLHTVGPIIEDEVTPEQEAQLASCYQSCLKLAQEHGLKSVAFCCISTGVFRFPKELAARIAVRTVLASLEGAQSVRRVIFNVFTDEDYQIYNRLLNS